MRRTPQEALAWSVPWPHDYVDDIGKEGDRGDDDGDVVDDDDFDVMMTFSRVLPEEEVEAERSARNLSLCTQLEINISNIISSKTCSGSLQVLSHFLLALQVL